MKKTFFFLCFLFISTAFSQSKNQSNGFIENKGQIIDQKGRPNPAVKFLLNSNGLNVQLRKNGFSYDIYEVKKTPSVPFQILNRIPEKEKKETEDNIEYVFHRVDIDFVNSNSNVVLIKEQESNDFDNYYNIPNIPEGVLGVHSFKQITYKNIYPNIDVVFTIPTDATKTVEYNFVVHPKGKISDIQLQFNGAKTEIIDNKIRMNVRFGAMDETLPSSWTEDKTGKKDIAISYKKIKNNVYGFETEINSSNKTIVIDPVPVRLWGTYFGGEGEENNFNGIVKTNNLSVYIGGYTSSLTNITTIGSYQQNHNGNDDAFIAKFNADGQRIWSTYYGGSSRDIFRTIDFDSNNNIYAAGITISTTNIATPNAHQTIYNDFNDAMLIKFDTDGRRIWGTYYGGEGFDNILTIKIDLNQDILIAGYSQSRNNITTPNSFKAVVAPASNGSNQAQEGFVAKFTKDGQRIWATFYGGDDGNDYISAIDVDSNNNIFCSGTTASHTGIATTGAYIEVYNQNNNMNWNDSFIVKFNTNGERLFGTYYGGDDYDYNNSIKIDKDNNFIIAGSTRSKDAIGTINSFQPISGGQWDSYLAKFTNNGKLIWSTFYGGMGDDGFWGKNSIDIDENNFIYFLTSGLSTNNISTLGAYQENLEGYTNLYIIKFKPTGERVWGTYYGGSAADYSGDISYERNGIFYISGWTYSHNNIATPDAFQNYRSGPYDTFLVKFKDCFSSSMATSNSPICIGNDLKLTISGGTDYLWTGPNGFSSTEQNPTIANATILNSGDYYCTITGTGGCDDTKKVNVVIGDIEAPVPNLATLAIINGNCNTLITTIPTATDKCAGSITATTASPLSYSAAGTYTIVWNYDDGNGNSSSQNQSVIITPKAKPTATTLQSFCIQENATISNITITGQNIKWYDTLINGNILPNTTALQNGTTYYASQTIDGCESERTPVTITIKNTAAPTGNGNQTFCSSQNPTLSAITVTGSLIKWYDAAVNGTLLSNTTLLQNGSTYYATQTEDGCESVNRLAVQTVLITTLPAKNHEEILCDDLNDSKEIVNLTSYNSNLIASTAGYSFSYYSTLAGAENEVASQTIANPTTYTVNLGTDTIYVRINSVTACYAIAVLKLTVVAKPIITIPDTVPICANSSITITADAGYDTYLWSTGETTQSIIVTNPDNFSVTVTKNYGAISCSSTKNFVVKKSTIATVTSIETKDWTDNSNMITVYTTGSGDFEYAIDGVNYQNSNQFTNLFSGAYTVSVRDKNGCGVVNSPVYLLMYPKFFTPNGDSYNDTWSIRFSENEPQLSVKIFDRYGKLITTLKQNQTWDGTINGQLLPSTDYWFVVIRADGKEYKGHFSMKR